MAFHHWFIPHKKTHQKAKLISWQAILIYILLFIGLQVSFSIISFTKPGILGISANIDPHKLIELTNSERQKGSLLPLRENEALNKAAELKAKNMFQENYWSHFAPSGKTPWDFILGAGYKFTFAGENLAKNFYDSSNIISAWMASSTHKENLLNPRYHDIGIAVVDGVLNGQKTTLIVQMFGTTQTLIGEPKVRVGDREITVTRNDYLNAPTLVAAASRDTQTQKLFIDPYQVVRISGFSLLSLLAILLTVDILVLYRRGVTRIGSHHIAHMSILGVAAGLLLLTSPGSIL